MEVQFLLGDATTYDWSDATMWFANSTCFDEALMLKLAVVAGACPRSCFAAPCAAAVLCLWLPHRVRAGVVEMFPSVLSHLSLYPLQCWRVAFPARVNCAILRQASCRHVRHHVHQAPAVGQMGSVGARSVPDELGQRHRVHPAQERRVVTVRLRCCAVAVLCCAAQARAHLCRFLFAVATASLPPLCQRALHRVRAAAVLLCVLCLLLPLVRCLPVARCTAPAPAMHPCTLAHT